MLDCQAPDGDILLNHLQPRRKAQRFRHVRIPTKTNQATKTSRAVPNHRKW